jgi:Bacterial regulatory protein, Fis family
MSRHFVSMPVAKDSPLANVAELSLDCEMPESELRRYLARARMTAALERSRGNITRGAKLLSVHRNTFTRLLRDLEMRHVPAEIRTIYRRQMRFAWAPEARFRPLKCGRPHRDAAARDIR